MKITDAAVQAALDSWNKEHLPIIRDVALRNALTAALPHLQPVDVAAVRRQAFEEAASRLIDLAGNAREKVKQFHAKQHDGKYGDRKKQRFYEEKKHFNRLAIGYSKSVRAIRALSAEPTLKGQQHDK